jgi:MFS superfamily sulfate permease-like transporter
VRFPKIRYSVGLFAGDLSGGFIAALIAIPYGLALASMMGLTPVLGLVTSIATAPITALLGRNPVLIGGTASATVPFIAHAVSLQGVGGAAKVCLAASIFMMVFSVLRLGRHIHKVPQPVVTGFSCGIGAMMFLSQLNTMLGTRVHVDRTSDNLLYQSWLVLASARHAQAATAVVSLIVIAVGFAVAYAAPKLPAPLIGVLAATAVALGFHLEQHPIGEIALHVPSFAGFAWTPRDVMSVLPAAFGLARGRTFSRPAPAHEALRCGRGAGRLWHCQCCRRHVRSSDERGHSGPKSRQRPLRWNNSNVEPFPRLVHRGFAGFRRKLHRQNPRFRAGRRHSVHRTLSP